MIVGLFVGIFIGYPIAFVMLGVCFLTGCLGAGLGFFSLDEFLPLIIMRTYHPMSDYVLAAVPLFIFMGVMMGHSGITERLFYALHVMLGNLSGGLAITTVVSCIILAATTGIIGASVVIMGIIAVPQMLKRKYDKSLTAGVVCAGGTLGILIPPSIMLIVYGPMAGISVGKLFMGALIPGVLLGILYIIYVAVVCRMKPELGPPLPREERMAIPARRKAFLTITSLFPPIIIIVSVLGSIFLGVAAPTEAAAIGALACLILTASYRNLNLHTVKVTAYQTLSTSSMVMLTVIGAYCYTGTFMIIGGGQVVEEFLLSLPISPLGILAVMLLTTLALGLFMEWIGILPIIAPIFTPIAIQLGFDPLWFAIVICVCMQTAFLTPPMAPAIFYLKGVCPKEVGTVDIFRGVVPFIALQVVGTLLVVLFPQLVLWLPSMMIK